MKRCVSLGLGVMKTVRELGFGVPKRFAVHSPLAGSGATD